MPSSHTPTTQSAGMQEGRANLLQHQLSSGDHGGGTAESSSVPCTSAGPSRKLPSVLSPPAVEKPLSVWIQGWHTGEDTLPGLHVSCLHQAPTFLPPPQCPQSKGHPSSVNFALKGLDAKGEGQAAFLSLHPLRLHYAGQGPAGQSQPCCKHSRFSSWQQFSTENTHMIHRLVAESGEFRRETRLVL